MLRFLSAAIVAALVHAKWSDGAPGWGLNGRNISTVSMTTNTSVECYNLCMNSAACAAWVMTVQSATCGGTAQCTLQANFGGDSSSMEGPTAPAYLSDCAISGPVNRAGSPLLQPMAFSSPPLPSLMPTGWLQAQLQVQISGLSGHLDLFWHDVNESCWLGGSGDGYLHERFPYWANGVIPLTALTGDVGSALRARIARDLLFIAQNATPYGDGVWLGPDDTKSGDQYWARFNMLASFLQWSEFNPDEASTYVPLAMQFVVEATRRMLGGDNMPYQLNDWSAARVQDYLLCLHYMIDRFAAYEAAGIVPAGISEATLYIGAAVGHAQGIGNGAVWESYFDGPSFPNSTVTQDFGMLTHGVNVQQAIKSAGVWWRQFPNSSLIDSTYIRIAKLDAFHGSPSGVVQADEHLAGFPPQHGTELCGVVEAAFSYEVLGDILGDPWMYERAELIAYNALPAAMTKDALAHNYLSQANEMQAVVSRTHPWITDGTYGNVYGLEPNYGCCTANMHQGWSKFAARLHKVVTATGGVAVAMWGPATSTLQLPAGGTATLTVTTDYPFGDTANVTVIAAAGTAVHLRIPSWATAATIAADGGAPQPVGSSNGTFYRTAVGSSGRGSWMVDFAPTIRVNASFYNSGSAIYRGGLLYGLEISQNVTILAKYPYGTNDYNITNTSSWNYAVKLNPADPAASISFQQLGAPSLTQPYNTSAPPVQLLATARLVPSWQLVNYSAASPPMSPVDCSAPGSCGPEVQVRLIPYGSTLLRMAVLPWYTA